MSIISIYKYNSQSKFILSFLFLLFSCTAFASSHSDAEKSVINSYPINADGELKITNKYGFIQCFNWEKDSIKIKAEVKVSSKSEEDTQELLNNIVPNFSASSQLVVIETEILSGKSNVLNKYLKDMNLFNKNNIDVNYTIWLPKSIDLSIDNKFGDVLLEEHTGRNDIKMSYGDLRLEKFTEKCKLDLKFGKLIARSLEVGNLDLKNFDVKLKYAKDLKINSSGSEIEIDEIENLVINSSRDEFKIEEVTTFEGSSKFSEIEIESLSESLELEMENGDMEIEEAANFVSLEIAQKSSHIEINVENTSFSLDADLEKSDLSVPNSVSNINKTVIDEKAEHRKISLTYGSNPNRTVVLKGKKGSFTFWE